MAIGEGSNIKLGLVVAVISACMAATATATWWAAGQQSELQSLGKSYQVIAAEVVDLRKKHDEMDRRVLQLELLARAPKKP